MPSSDNTNLEPPNQPQQQWQLYNPLDKITIRHKPQTNKSNTLPFCKPTASVTKEKLMQPKISSLGVHPTRSSLEVNDLRVMMVGSNLNTDDIITRPAIVEEDIKEPEKNDVKTPEKPAKPRQKARDKMPAILNTEGTTTQARFVLRAKPPSMPRSKLKIKRPTKPLVPPNSSASRRSEGVTWEQDVVDGPSQTGITESRKTSGKSIQSEKGTVLSVEISEPAPSPGRSIDDMIQTLRSSRHTSASKKSMSDQKIDEILQQVMDHAKEWVTETKHTTMELPDEILEPSSEEKEPASEPEITATDSGTVIPQILIDVDISDTVSTLASQISASAGIPDVSSILLRKSSHAMRESQMSTTSSPIAMLQDEDDDWDYEQAVHDFNLTLDVQNSDILSVQGRLPPQLEKTAKPAVDEDSESESGHKISQSGSATEFAGKIHRLCILPAINEINVKPREMALTKAMHTAHNVNPVDISKDEIISNLQQAVPKISEPVKTHNASKGDYFEKEKREYIDSSQLDPLDIEGWRRLVEGKIEKKDYTLHGIKSDTAEWGMWRLLWTVAPPKMALSSSAVKALVFPRYHGTQLPGGEESDEESWQGDDDLSDIKTINEDEFTFNPRTLNRRHRSAENLSQRHKEENEDEIKDEREEKTKILRTFSLQNLHFNTQDFDPFTKLKTDYVTAMSEIKQQKESVYQQHIKDLEETKQRQYLEEQQLQQQRSKQEENDEMVNTNSSVSLNTPRKSMSQIRTSTISFKPNPAVNLAGQAKAAGRSYVMYTGKKLKPVRSKRFVQSVRKLLSLYEPKPLVRSTSASSLNKLPVKKKEDGFGLLRGKLKRSTSVPRFMDFNWFIGQHHKYEEKIEDLREWVRDIWNVWFDELYPPTSDESSYFSDVEEISPLGDDMEQKKTKSEHRHLVIPDQILPAVANVTEEIEKPEEVMQEEVKSLTEQIGELKPEEKSRKAFHLARRGTLHRKLGDIKDAFEDFNLAVSLEPQLAQAYWQRHLIRLLRNQQHEALDDLNILLKINKKNVDAYRSRGDIFVTLGDYTMAVVNYSQAIKLDPNEENLYYQRASVFEKTGDMLLAMEDYGSVMKLNPDRTDAIFRRAVFCFERKTYQMAISDFTLLMEREPLNAVARTYRGRAYAEVKQHTKALVDLSAAIHLDPNNHLAFYHRGALLRTAAPERALQDLSISFLINDTETNVLALLHRGILYSEMKRYQEAMADLEQTLRLDQSMACAHVNIGLIHLQVTSNFWEAIRQFTLAIKGDPTYPRSYVCRSDALARIHNYQSALYDITRAIHLRPTESHLYLRRGKLLLQLKELKLAAFCVRHIATLEKGFVSTSPTQQAVVQSFLGNHSAAIDSLTAACRTKPVPQMYVLLAKTLMKGKRFKEAISNLKNSIELSTLFAYGEVSSLDHEPPEAAEMYFLLGQCHTELNKHTDALHAYNRALKVNQNYAEAYYQRGLCRLKLEHSKGVQDLNRALALKPNLFEAYLSRAAFYSTKGRSSKAILNCNEALRLRPQSVRALLCRGALKYHISAYHHAIKDLTKAIQFDKQCSLAYYNRAVCLHKTKKYDKALKDYSVVLILTDSVTTDASLSLRVRVFVNRALLYLESGLSDARNAALDFEEAALLSHEDTNILHTMAICYHKLQDLALAENSYTRCLEVDPFFLKAYVGRGDVYGDGGRLEEAKYEYQKALVLDPTCVEARVHLGYNLQMSGHLQQAWVQFTKAIKLDENSQSALEGRAITCLHAGDLTAASCDLSLALKRGPPSARLLTACGVVNQCQHDLHTAMAQYTKAKSMDPSYTPAYFNCAVLYMRDRRFNDALQCLDHVIESQSGDSAAILNRAITKIFLNDSQGALEDFNTSIELDPYNSHAYYNRGNLFNMLKKHKEAESNFTKALEINPGDFVTLKRRADIRGQLGFKQAAVEDYKQALVLYERHRMIQRRKIRRN